MPDDITIPMVLDILKNQGDKGWLLDGFPRNMEQARKLDEALKAAGMKLDYVVEILLPRKTARERIMGRRLCVNNNNHPNNIFIDAIKPNGDVCRVCGGALKTRPDDQDEAAINKRHDIYYDEKNGTLAAAHYFKDLAARGETTYITLDGSGTIESIREDLLSKLKVAGNFRRFQKAPGRMRSGALSCLLRAQKKASPTGGEAFHVTRLRVYFMQAAGLAALTLLLRQKCRNSARQERETTMPMMVDASMERRNPMGA